MVQLLLFALLLVVFIVGGLAVTRRAATPYPGLAAASLLAAWGLGSVSLGLAFGWRAAWGDALLVGLAVCCGLLPLRARAAAPPRYAFPLPWLDAALLAVVALVLAVPIAVLPVPLDTDAQGFGYLALTARIGGDLAHLAPFHPTTGYLYSNSFPVLNAYLSTRLGLPLHVTQLATGAALAFLVVWAAYDWGQLLGGRERGRAHVVALGIGLGLFTAFMDSHYTALMGLAFGAALLACAGRFAQGGGWGWLALSVLHMAALVHAQPDATLIAGFGYGAALLLWPLARPGVAWRRWLALALAVPGLALVLLLPWLWGVRHLLGANVVSPFERDPVYWQVALGVPPQTLYQGPLIALVALIGLAWGLRRRAPAALLALGWLLLVLDFSAFGVLETVAPALAAPVLRYDYPFSLAWHGPVLPLMLLAGLALERVQLPRRAGWALLSVLAVGVLTVGVLHRPLLAASKGRVTFFGAFASHADVRALAWVRANTPPDARLLNFPGPQEGDWAPVIAERNAVYYRPQPFFRPADGTDPLAETPEQIALRAFWQTPTDPAHLDLLRAHAIDYVVVPEVVGNPASFADQFRWRAPFTTLVTDGQPLPDIPYLTRVFADGGAQVYAVP